MTLQKIPDTTEEIIDLVRNSKITNKTSMVSRLTPQRGFLYAKKK